MWRLSESVAGNGISALYWQIWRKKTYLYFWKTVFTARRKGQDAEPKCTFKWGTKVTATYRSSLGFYINDLQSLYNFSAMNYRFTLQYSFYSFKNIFIFIQNTWTILYSNHFYREKRVLRERKQMKTLTYLKPCNCTHRPFCLCKPISLT